jgi:hypothetical protein
VSALDRVRAALSDASLDAVDFAAGVLATRVPPFAAPVFLRLAAPASDLVDEARAAYLLVAAPELQACRPGWIGGPGVAVDPASADRARLDEEVHHVARALRVLSDESVARHYLELTQPRVVAGPATTPTEGRNGA